MCQICDSWETGKLTNKEAFKAIGEKMTSKNTDHLMALSEKILDKEMNQAEHDPEMDHAWQKEMTGK